MPRRGCSVPKCTTYQPGAVGISFYGFPKKNLELRRKWLEAIGRPDYVPNKEAAICSKHFSAKDMVETTRHGYKTGQTPAKLAVPSLFLPHQPLSDAREIPWPGHVQALVLGLRACFNRHTDFYLLSSEKEAVPVHKLLVQLFCKKVDLSSANSQGDLNLPVMPYTTNVLKKIVSMLYNGCAMVDSPDQLKSIVSCAKDLGIEGFDIGPKSFDKNPVQVPSTSTLQPTVRVIYKQVSNDQGPVISLKDRILPPETAPASCLNNSIVTPLLIPQNVNNRDPLTPGDSEPASKIMLMSTDKVSEKTDPAQTDEFIAVEEEEVIENDVDVKEEPIDSDTTVDTKEHILPEPSTNISSMMNPIIKSDIEEELEFEECEDETANNRDDTEANCSKNVFVHIRNSDSGPKTSMNLDKINHAQKPVVTVINFGTGNNSANMVSDNSTPKNLEQVDSSSILRDGGVPKIEAKNTTVSNVNFDHCYLRKS